MNHILDLNSESIGRLDSIFETISKGDMILFLGAGASITNKKYLSDQIIEYYEDKIGTKFNIPDITKLIDILESSDTFIRTDFDNYVYELLNRLEVTDTHRTIVKIPWQQIITTNYDLLVEKAFDQIKDMDNLLDIKPIRSIREFLNFTLRNEIKYIKLNGCMSDKSNYPFVFSTNDFRNSKKYHDIVLNNLKSASYKTNFLSVGYSFNDKFGERFLDLIDEKDYREKRWLYKVDPDANEKMLSYYTSKKICIVKLTSDDFFKRYRLWEESFYKDKQKKYTGLTLRSSDNSNISLPPKLAYNFKNSIVQLNNSFQGTFISKQQFYNGEEPNFNVILKNFDIQKTKTLTKTKDEIFKIVNNNTSSLIPIFFLIGTFGTGKSTFGYRLVQNIQKSNEQKTLTIEIKEIDNNVLKSFPSVIQNIKEDYLILFLDNVENNSVFKSMIAFRTAISSQQLNHLKVLFVVPIRENMLKTNTLNFEYKNIYEIHVDTKLETHEISEFVTNLQECSIINYRDNQQKKEIVERIRNTYQGDSFVALIELASNGKHLLTLRDAYKQLTLECRNAFIYTALLHRLKILMPATLLRRLISKPWDDFINEVIKGDGKGIIIQEEKSINNAQTDLYFRTKHPIIAEKLISEIIKSTDKKYNLYKNVIGKLLTGPHFVDLANDLLKAISRLKEFDNEKVNRLYDAAYLPLQDEPYFLLNYATNLQGRNDIYELQRAIELIHYAEGLLDYKSDRFIHRRGALHFALAQKLYYEETDELNLTIRHLNEAKELFEEKQLLDPCSSYSYVDYIGLLLWELEKVELDSEEELLSRVKIEENIEQGLSSVIEGTNRIIDLKKKYTKNYKYLTTKANYLNELEGMYSDPLLRPLACILKYNYYLENNKESDCEDSIKEMFEYLDNYEVGLFLFKYYSKKLNYIDSRLNFFRVVRNANLIKEKKPLHYNFYMFVAEAYSNNFTNAFSYLKDIEKQHYFINPDFHQIWNQPENDEPKIFAGKIVDYKGRFLAFRSLELQKVFFINKGNQIKVSIGDDVNCNLHLALNGIRAEIIEVVK